MRYREKITFEEFWAAARESKFDWESRKFLAAYDYLVGGRTLLESARDHCITTEPVRKLVAHIYRIHEDLKKSSHIITI